MITHKAQEVIQAIGALSSEEKNYILESLLKFQTEPEIQKLSDLQAQYPNEWLAVILPAGEDRYAPSRGYLFAHSRERASVWRQVAQLPSSDDVYVFFTGAPSVKGFGVTFHDTADSPVVASVGD